MSESDPPRRIKTSIYGASPASYSSLSSSAVELQVAVRLNAAADVVFCAGWRECMMNSAVEQTLNR